MVLGSLLWQCLAILLAGGIFRSLGNLKLDEGGDATKENGPQKRVLQLLVRWLLVSGNVGCFFSLAVAIIRLVG